MDWESEGLLEGVEGEARADRRALLEELHGDGVSSEELRAAVAEDRLVLLPIERALMGTPRYSARDVAERSGLPLDVLIANQRILGQTAGDDPDALVFGEEDLHAAQRTAQYLESGLPLDELRSVLRVMSTSMSRAAEAIRQMFGAAYLQPGDTELDLGRRYGEMARALMPPVVDDLEYLLRLHLREFTRHDALGMAERHAGELPQTAEVAVGFADVVGFTKLGEELPESALGDMADHLTELADEHLVKPARVVKTIGDAVMLVSREPAALLDSLLSLVEAADNSDELPPLRAGATWGRALPRGGDWYGGTVNLASRLCSRARPGSVLVTKAMRAVVDRDGYEWSDAGLKRLKGIEEPLPALRVRRRGQTPQQSS